MSRLSRIILGYLVSFLFIVIPAKAQKEAEVYNVDSSLYAYYQRCQEHLLEPVVLSMSDTLFRMASGQNDQRMQAVALSTRLDYYYYQANNEDSIIFYTNKVKQFAKEIQQSKYYYFAWANRLILYYLKTGRSNIALYEAEKVLKEAQAEDNKTGLMYCYNIMSQIYTIKNFDVMASEWRVKEIELTEKYKLENYNISNTYAQLANYYITHHQPEPALEALEKAVKTANELNTLQQKYETSQKILQEKEDKITTNLIIIIALCVLSAILAAGLLFLATLLFKHIRQVKKLKHSLQIANENNEQKSKFIGNISAQIEPSLNTIDEATKGTISTPILHENIKALKELMTAIQTYISLEETREEHYPLKELNINTLCESIMEKAKINFKSGVEAVVNVPRVNIKTNAEELERILNHLLNNAAEYTKSGKISLEFKKRSAHTHQFILTDTGTGIPVEARERLFKPFAKIRDLTQGNGLGLPTCSLIAYKLNGTLTLDTDYKKGTRFILELHV